MTDDLEPLSKCVARVGALEIAPFDLVTAVFPENLGLSHSHPDVQVPHSELAIHLGAAGKPILAMKCKGRGCIVAYATGDGGCSTLEGPRSSVLSVDMRKRLDRWGFFRDGTRMEGVVIQ